MKRALVFFTSLMSTIALALLSAPTIFAAADENAVTTKKGGDGKKPPPAPAPEKKSDKKQERKPEPKKDDHQDSGRDRFEHKDRDDKKDKDDRGARDRDAKKEDRKDPREAQRANRDAQDRGSRDRDNRNRDSRDRGSRDGDSRDRDQRRDDSRGRDSRDADSRNRNSRDHDWRHSEDRGERYEGNRKWDNDRRDEAQRRIERVRENREVYERMERVRYDYRYRCGDRFEKRRTIYIDHETRYRDRYRNYWDHGFHGGFYFGYHPVRDLSAYFYIPLWSSFYLDRPDPECSSAWFGARVELHDFHHRRHFHATEEFYRSVAIVSDYEWDVQLAFQKGMDILGDQLSDRLAQITGRRMSFDDDDIVINDSQVLNRDAVVYEGSVEWGNATYGFKALVDLRYPDSTMVYVPGNTDFGYRPAYEELETLNRINDRILNLGGTVDRN